MATRLLTGVKVALPNTRLTVSRSSTAFFSPSSSSRSSEFYFIKYNVKILKECKQVSPKKKWPNLLKFYWSSVSFTCKQVWVVTAVSYKRQIEFIFV